MNSFPRQHQKPKRKENNEEPASLHAHAQSSAIGSPGEAAPLSCPRPGDGSESCFSPHRRQRAVLSPAVEKQLTPLSCSEWCLCRSAAVYGIMSYNPASLPSYPVISNVEKLVSSESNM